jgi:hypothetical protein|tara:strand:- start:107 stop:418 length:312 start_codon:yes stop_codon:yes gene_type:complete
MENENAPTTTTSNYRLPGDLTMQHITKIGIVNDKPIMLDYWTKSLAGEIIIGIREGGEKLLVKSEEEYTSPISKIYKVEKDYIIETENSLYLADSSIPTKRIS